MSDERVPAVVGFAGTLLSTAGSSSTTIVGTVSPLDSAPLLDPWESSILAHAAILERSRAHLTDMADVFMASRLQKRGHTGRTTFECTTPRLLARIRSAALIARTSLGVFARRTLPHAPLLKKDESCDGSLARAPAPQRVALWPRALRP